MAKQFLLEEKSRSFLHYSHHDVNLYLYPHPNSFGEKGAYAWSEKTLERGEFEYVVRKNKKFLKLTSEKGEVKFLLVQKGRLIY